MTARDQGGAGPRQERSTCPLCGAEGGFAFEKSGYAHHECRGCRTLYLSPIPSADELAAFYGQPSPDLGSGLCWDSSSRHAHAMWRTALRQILAFAGHGPVLDVGCGAGQFLAFARDAGLKELEGIELSAEAAAAARQRSGARVLETTLDALEATPGRYAALTLWDVIEHLPDPRSALARAFALLRPGGAVVIGTPNRMGITLRVRGRASEVVRPPEHVFVASARGLRAAARSAGFEVRRVDSIDVRLQEWTGRRADDGPARAVATADPEAYKRRYDRLTGSWWFSSAQAAANLLLDATTLGDQLIVVAQRPAGRSRSPR